MPTREITLNTLHPLNFSDLCFSESPHTDRNLSSIFHYNSLSPDSGDVAKLFQNACIWPAAFSTISCCPRDDGMTSLPEETLSNFKVRIPKWQPLK